MRLTLAEKNIPYERILVDLSKDEQRKPEFLALNPYGKVPVIKDNGFVLRESAIINEYLEETYSMPALMPQDPQKRAYVRLWVSWCDDELIPKILDFLKELRKPLEQRSSEILESAWPKAQEVLKVLDQSLVEKAYLVGDFSLADITLAPTISALWACEQAPYLQDFRNISLWMERVKARPSWDQSK